MKLFFCVMFALLFVNCACAQAATLNASDYTTIQAAIDNSTSGDIIFISNGTYYERLNINKSISLIGESSTGVIIDGDYSIYETLSPIHDYWSGCSVLIIQSDVDDFNGYNISNLTLNITLRGDVVSIYADNVSLSNLTLQSSRGYFADAVLYLQGNSANIFNIITKETCNGVYIVSENNYIDNVFTPFDNSTLKGISLIGAKNNTVTNSITSFYIRSGAEDNYFENNTVKAREKNGIKMNSGMSLAESNKNRIKNNKVAGRLDLFNSNNNCITYNEISDILYTYASYNNSFEDNSAPILESNGVKIDVSAYQLPPLLLLNNITVYFELTSSLVVNENNTVEVRIYYNKTLVTLLGILPSKLSIKYYNETSLAWENIPSSVNEKEGYVFAVLTHLSTYTLSDKDDFGAIAAPAPSSEEQSSSSSSSSSNSGSWGGGISYVYANATTNQTANKSMCNYTINNVIEIRNITSAPVIEIQERNQTVYVDKFTNIIPWRYYALFAVLLIYSAITTCILFKPRKRAVLAMLLAFILLPSFCSLSHAETWVIDSNRTSALETVYVNGQGQSKLILDGSVFNEKENGAWMQKQYNLSFKESAKQNTLFEIEDNIFKVKANQTHIAINYSDELAIFSISITPDTIPKISGNKITYRSDKDNITVEYAISKEGITKMIMLYDPKFKTKDAEFTENFEYIGNGTIDNETLTFGSFKVKDLIIWDSNGTEYPLKKLAYSDKKITLKINKTWLETARFPIFIDPELTIVGTSVEMFGNYTYDYVELKNGAIINVAALNATAGTGYINITATINITIDATSIINANEKGYSGGTSVNVYASNFGGGGAGTSGGANGSSSVFCGNYLCAFGGGGGGGAAGHANAAGSGSAGTAGTSTSFNSNGGAGGAGGSEYGTSFGYTYFLGSGGGAGGSGGNVAPDSGNNYWGTSGTAGGRGGGAIFLKAPLANLQGQINAKGGSGGAGGTGGVYGAETLGGSGGSGGGAAGGTILLDVDVLNLSAKLNLSGGSGSASGSGGRIKIWFSTIYNSTAIFFAGSTYFNDTTPDLPLTIQSPANASYAVSTTWFNITLNQIVETALFSLDGAANVSMTNSSGNWNYKNTTMTQGAHTVLFFVNNSLGASNSTSVAFTIDTIAPSYSNFSINSSEIRKNDTISISALWNDLFSGLSQYIFSTNMSGTWVNTTYDFSGNWSNVSVQNIANKTNSVSYLFYANDTYGNMNQTTIQSFIVNNTAPVVTAAISPSPAQITDNLNCTYTYYDVDKDVETGQRFQWYINGILNETTTQNLSAGNLTLGDNVICGVKANDGTDNSTWANSSEITIGDTTAPDVHNQTISATTGQITTAFTVGINVTELNSVQLVSVEITEPDATATNYTMTLSGNKSGSESYFVKSYTPATEGNYSFRFFASDGSSNLGSMNGTQNYTATAIPVTPPASGGGGSSNPQTMCGNKICEINENNETCPVDCAAKFVLFESQTDTELRKIVLSGYFSSAYTYEFRIRNTADDDLVMTFTSNVKWLKFDMGGSKMQNFTTIFKGKGGIDSGISYIRLVADPILNKSEIANTTFTISDGRTTYEMPVEVSRKEFVFSDNITEALSYVFKSGKAPAFGWVAPKTIGGHQIYVPILAVAFLVALIVVVKYGKPKDSMDSLIMLFVFLFIFLLVLVLLVLISPNAPAVASDSSVNFVYLVLMIIVAIVVAKGA